MSAEAATRRQRSGQVAAKEVLLRLSRVADKRARYCEEVLFREAWCELSELAGVEAIELLLAHALVLFKPDAFAAGAAGRALTALAEQEFTPVAAHVVHLDRLTTRWLWLYRFNVASVERVWLHDLINTAGPSLVVVLRDERAMAGDPLPGCVRLTDHKGPSRMERRRPDQLRSRLGVADRLLNYMHTSDEPADLLRELSILLDRQGRGEILQQMIAGEDRHKPVAALIESMEAQAKYHPLERDFALASICARAREHAADTPADAGRWQEISRMAEGAQRGVDGGLRSLWSLLKEVAAEIDRWDLVVVGSAAIEYDEPGVTRQSLGDAPPSLWLAG